MGCLGAEVGVRDMSAMRSRMPVVDEDSQFIENVVDIYRCAKVVKGGRRFSFSALVTVGDGSGKIGIGYGKANEVPPAVEKARKIARNAMKPVILDGTTIPHQVLGRYGASKVVLVPAGRGTGVIAGASVRAVLECAGVSDVLTKAYGSTSPKNLVKATLNGLNQLRSLDMIQKLRGVDVPISNRRRNRMEAAAAAELKEKQAREAVEAKQSAIKEAGPKSEPATKPSSESTGESSTESKAAPVKAETAAPEKTAAEKMAPETAAPKTAAPESETKPAAPVSETKPEAESKSETES